MTPPLTLALDASTYASSVAVLLGDTVVAEREAQMRGVRSERLMPAVAEALADAGVRPTELARVVCGAGPGSFTSLRIAASTAKGIAWGQGIPLFAVSSLLLIVAGSSLVDVPGRYLAVLDAMRGEVFVEGYEVGLGKGIRAIVPRALMAREQVAAEASRIGARAVGPGEATTASPHARGVAVLGWSRDAVVSVDVANWEPAYGRQAEAQVKWEAAHGRPLPAA
jgi:tRNA threonylcarbamoyladenosine biosynthesis protein TsaB